MVNFRELEPEEKLRFYSNEFDGQLEFTGTVSVVDEDHAILRDSEGFDWWIDDDTADQFFRPEETRKLREVQLRSRREERCCRKQPAPFTIHGEQGSYDFFVERFDPGERGKIAPGPVIYIGSNRQTQEFVNILNFDHSDYRDRLLACTEMRSSLEIRVMEGADYTEKNVAVEYPFLTEKTEQRSTLLKIEMSKLHYFYDEERSDRSMKGEKVYTSGISYQSLRFRSDADTLGWLKNNPDISMEHRRELYEQTKPERMEEELRQRKGALKYASKTQKLAIAINISDSGYAALFSPNVPQATRRRDR